MRSQTVGERPDVLAITYDLPVMAGRRLSLALQFVEGLCSRRTRRSTHGPQTFDAELFEAMLLIRRFGRCIEV